MFGVIISTYLMVTLKEEDRLKCRKGHKRHSSLQLFTSMVCSAISNFSEKTE
jgi:hypothetical protein